jgi:hypothetical protein
MKYLAIDEFCSHASDYLDSGVTVAIVREGVTIGTFVPSEEIRRARLSEGLDRLGELVQKILLETGMTEDEFARYFDLTQPMPDDPFPTRRPIPVTVDASRD